MAAGIGGVLMIGAGLVLLLATLRLSDGSLLLAGPPRINILPEPEGSTNAHHLQKHQYRQQRRTTRDMEEQEHKLAAAERWLLYDSGNGNGFVELEGIPPPSPSYKSERRRSHEKVPPGLPPPWKKRDHQEEHAAEGGGGKNPPEIPQGMATQFITRSARARDGSAPFDVPMIECPPAEEDGMERFACPTPDRMGRYRCIDDHVLCDGFIDCPSGEDEDRQACMFYKTTKAHLDILADALLRWARGR